MLFLLSFMASFLLPSLVWADGISAVVELDYTQTKEKIRDSGRLLTESKVDTFVQRYFLNLDRHIYPNLKFMAGGTFEKDVIHIKADGDSSNTTATTKNGHLDLVLDTRFISSGIGYNRNENDASEQPSPFVRENYNANLTLRPEGLPLVNTNYIRTYTYDKDRDVEDTVNDFLSVSSKYSYKNLELQGQVLYNDKTDKLQDLDTTTWNYNFRASYARQFFRDRVSSIATYNFSGLDTTVSASGGGKVLFQVFPFEGYSDQSDTPERVTLARNQLLVDSILDVSAGSDLDLGPPPITENVIPRNIGVDFIVPADVNTVYVWVDRQVPASVANLFSWDIYVSENNEDWTFVATVSRAPFGRFDNRFEIDIPTVSSRYLKVVTNPLPRGVIVPPGTDLSHIYVTEMQTFLRKRAEGMKETTSTQRSHLYDLSVKWRILDIPNLVYDFYYWSLITQPNGEVRYLLSNSLNVSHRFNKVFVGTARIGREDTWNPNNNTHANIYSASVTAVPLPTLYHSLVVSGREEQTEEGTNNTNSVYVNNTAILYKGLTANLSGGVSFANPPDGGRITSTSINTGVTAIPHRALTVNVNYSQTNSEQSGGNNSSSYTRTGNLSIAFTPFSSLYIYASFGVNAQNDRDTVTQQNYSVTWSPFQEGDLQFSFFYSDSRTSEDVRERIITPSLRWYLRRNTTLDVSYTINDEEVLRQKTDTRVFSANLRVALF